MVVLSGGKSSRMGTDKALLQLRSGETLLEQAVRTGRELLSERDVYVSGSYPAYRCIADLKTDCGPIGGIHAALRTLCDSYERVLFTPVDMPCISAGLMRGLLYSSDKASRYHESELPLALPFDHATSCAVDRVIESDDFSLRHLYRLINPLQLSSSDKNTWALNLNGPSEYREFVSL